MRQLFKRDKMTPKLTAIGHNMAFNNEQSQFLVSAIKRPEMIDKRKTIQTRKLTA